MKARRFLLALALSAAASAPVQADGAIYVATNGGLSISADGGSTWSNDTGILGGLAGNRVSGVCVVVGGKIYAATWLSGLFISPGGGGKIWIGYSDPVISRNVNSVYAAGNDVYASTVMGLSLSTNGGTTWTRSLATYVVNRVAVSGSTIYAATSGAGLEVSNDGGSNWTSYLGTSAVPDVCVAGSTIYAAAIPSNGGVGGGLWVSTDAGFHWTQFLANGTIQSVCVVGSTIYVVNGQAVSISTDNGATWKDYLKNHAVRRVYVSGNTIYAESGAGLWVSTDGGSNWTTWTTANGLAGNDVYDVFVQ
jgi:hypothetical protein